MLFHVEWEFTDRSEEGVKRSLEVFSRWQPPEGTDFSQAFYGYADGSGGFALVESDSAAALAQATAPFAPWLDFTAKVVLPIQDSAAIAGSGIAFRGATS